MKSFKITQSITDRQDASLGIFLKEVNKIPLLSIEEEIELCNKIKNGDKDASDKLVVSNLRFVISVAKQYQHKGVPLVDLIQSGIEGLITASTKWDSNKGFKFITYAVWWIRQSIIRAVSSECRTIRIPMSQVVNMNKIYKASEKIEQETYRKASIEEIENETNLDSNKIALILNSINRSVSLDTPFKDEEVGCLIDIIPNENSESTDEYSSRNDLKDSIEYVLSELPFRERDVIRMSFGIDMEPMQNEKIAVRFGLGTERVRQIQKETLYKIKKEYGDILRELL